MKRLIINVDDLGLSDAVNEAVVHLAEKKRISATSYMVGGTIIQEHQQALTALNIDVGLHLDFTGIFASDLTGSLSSILLRSYGRQLNKQAVSDNICQQFDDFEDCFGHLPIFVDGHQHVHQFPIIRDCLLAELKKRTANNTSAIEIASRVTQPLFHDLKSWIIYLLGGNTWSVICTKNHITTNEGFLGVYGFNKNYQQLVDLWESWLSACPTYSEYSDLNKQSKKNKQNRHLAPLIMCHPAIKDPNWTDEIKSARELEYQWLISDEFQQMLARHEVEVTGWNSKAMA